MDHLSHFTELWLVSFKFQQQIGCARRPICCSALEFRTGRQARAWLWDGQPACPYPLGREALFVSFDTTASLDCHLALSWPMPARTLDLGAEFRWRTNGRDVRCGRGLVGALIYFGLNALLGVDDEGLRRLAQLGGPFPRSQQEHLLASCTEEADALRQLLQKMLPGIDVPRAIWRGRFMAALSSVERTGIPVDETKLQTLQDRWDEIKRSLVKEADPDSAFFAGTRFRADRWLRYVESRGMKWPRHKSGQLVLDDVAFKRAAETYPEVRAVWQVRRLLSQLQHVELPVGPDGRTRYASGAFGSITGRCQPRTESCILLWPRWTRGLIQPPPGRGLAWLDYAQQEWLVAAALSRDEAMLRDYSEGDCYLALGQRLGLISPGTDAGPDQERELCKSIALAALYGQRATGLARRVNRPITVAADWLRRHRERYGQFWRWSDATVDFARCHGRLWTRFGWQVHVGLNTRETTLRNWRVQATAGEILRLALCLLTEAGVTVNATLHDAVLIEADTNMIEAEAEELMIRASSEVLGFPLRVHRQVIRHPQRLLDGRGKVAWEKIWQAAHRPEPLSPMIPLPYYE